MRRIILGLFVLALLAGGAWAQTPSAGWNAFVIRENGGTPPDINDVSGVYGAGAMEFATTGGGQKAGLGTDALNGAKISQIGELHIDRLDDVLTSGSLYGPYFNIWITDGAGNYAVVANEPSNGAWAADRWYSPDWDFLKTKVAKIYEVPGWNTGTSWAHTAALANGWDGVLTNLTFEHLGDLAIAPPPEAYITNPANGVGGGAPDELGTNVAYGYNWIFGDTAANYVSGGDGFIVNNYYVTASYPVTNVTQGTEYFTIQAALDAANPNDAISVAAGDYPEQLSVTVAGVSITGAGVGATVIQAFDNMPLSFTTSAANYPVVLVNGVGGVTLNDLTVDGLGKGNTNNKYIGVAYYNAGGALNDVHVTNVVETPFSGNQHGVGVYCYADDGGPWDFDMTDVTVDLFQKTAVAIAGAGVTSDLLRVDCTGAGPTTVTAQNGIQAGFEAVVNATDCDIAGINYTGASNYSASGVLSFANGIGNFTDCNIDGCQTSAYFSDGGGSFDGCTVTNPVGDALYAYSGGAKAASDRPAAQPFDSGLPAKGNKAAIVVTIDGSTFTGTGAVDSWGPTAFGSGPITFTIDNSTVTNWDYGVVFYDFGGMVVTGSGANNDLAGNITYGAFSNALQVVDMTNNDWGDPSGPYHPTKNPNGLGSAVSDMIDFVPWIGRTTSLIAAGATPTGAFYWEGTPAIGVDGDNAPGWDPGAIQAPNAYTRYGFDTDTVFGREVLFGEIYNISYNTKKGTTHGVDPEDWYFILYTKPYTGSPGSTWYGNRINSEPYFSESLNAPANTWNEWQTDAGDNQLRFFDSSTGYFGAYTDPFLQDMTTDPAYAAQPIYLVGLTVGTDWAAGFDGLLDGFTIELVSGETFTMNFLSGNAQVAATPATNGPLNCSESQTVTFGVELSEDMPDLFLYNAVVRATSEVSFGAITDLLPFGTMNNTFFALDNGDGSYTITGSTVGSPTYPVTAPGTADLFSIEFNAESDGTAAITFDSLVLRDPDNNTIPVVTSGATIEVDCTVPAAVTGITADPGHNKIEVAWTHDGTDVATYEVYRGLWYDTTEGVSAYPEYDDLAGDVIPTRPADLDDAITSDEWEHAGSVAVGTNTLVDTDYTDATRGVYYYEVFPVDAAANPAPTAAANDRATSYWLGDLDQSPGGSTPDGEVDSFDMTVLGTAFGESEGDTYYNNEADVGPTDDWSRTGIPTTDSVINFEDLIVFAMNFGVVNSAKVDVPVGTSVDLAWVAYDDGTMGLRLDGGHGLKGVRVTADLPVHEVTAGTLLDEQDEMTFVRNVGDKLDVSVAVMGVNTTFRGTGDLFVVSAAEAIAMDRLTITARAIDNSEMKISLASESDTATPRVFALNANYPNPFNPMTKISFSLPASQDVRLSVYGIDGRLVRSLVNETRGPGLHEVIWNGQDDTGRGVASGTYFYRIEAGPYSDVKKMTLMK